MVLLLYHCTVCHQLDYEQEDRPAAGHGGRRLTRGNSSKRCKLRIMLEARLQIRSIIGFSKPVKVTVAHCFGDGDHDTGDSHLV